MKTKLLAVTCFVALACWCAGQAYGQTPAQGPPSTAGQGPEGNVTLVAGPVPQQITANSAEVTWETNRKSSTILNYGTNPAQLTQKAQHAWGNTFHQVKLTNLQPGTKYYVSVVTQDQREIGRNEFTTLASQSQGNQFKITDGPVVESVSPHSVVVAWTTSAPSSSVVMYGTDPYNLQQRAEAPWGQQTHRVAVNNLQPNTKYWFYVVSGQAQGTGATAQSIPFPVNTIQTGQQALTFNPR